MTLNARRSRDRKRTAHLRVRLDGRLRPEAFYVDGRRGVVREYKLNDKGHKYVENGDVAWQELRGRVSWMRV